MNKTFFGRIGFLLGMTLVFGMTTLAHAQGQLASGTISSSGSGPYTYNLSFTDDPTATASIGSIWYSWVPGQFYLPGTPTSASAPAGWIANISLNSVQFIANTPANYIAPGQTLSGFSYQASFTPGQLAAAPNGGTSVAYTQGILSSVGDTFTVQSAPVPEPSTPVLLLLGAPALRFVRRGKLVKVSLAG